MIIDIVTSNLSILFIYIDYILRCCDSGCTCGKRTKKKRKEKYYNLYIGPIFPLEVRYSGILTNLVISLILGPGMPLLYIVFYINIIVTFLVNKYMILCYHRNPPHYNLNFTRIFIVITGIALLCHLFISIWIYGEPSLFVDLPSEYGEYVFKDKVKKRVTKYINIVYIGVAVISITFGVLFYWFKCRPVKIKKKENYKKTKEYDFVQASNSETLKKMKTGLELELFQTLKEEQTNTNVNYYRLNLQKTITYLKNGIDDKRYNDLNNKELNKTLAKNILEGETFNPITNAKIEPLVIFNYLENL